MTTDTPTSEDAPASRAPALDPRPSDPPMRFTRGGVVATALGALAIIASYAALGLSRSTVDLLVEEDGVFEYAGAAGLLAGAVFFALAAVRMRRSPRSGVSRLKPWVLGALAFGLFLAAGEEISWGQRIFGIETPEGLRESNVQQETNLHNLNGIEGLGDQLFQAFWAVGFVLLPLAAWAIRPVRDVLGRYLPIAPIGIAILLVTAFLAGHAARSAFDGDAYTSSYPLDHSTIEIKEGLIGVLLGVAGLLALRAARRATAAGDREHV